MQIDLSSTIAALSLVVSIYAVLLAKRDRTRNLSISARYDPSWPNGSCIHIHLSNTGGGPIYISALTCTASPITIYQLTLGTIHFEIVPNQKPRHYSISKLRHPSARGARLSFRTRSPSQFIPLPHKEVPLWLQPGELKIVQKYLDPKLEEWLNYAITNGKEPHISVNDGIGQTHQSQQLELPYLCRDGNLSRHPKGDPAG
jgi:hypothetical protein